ncbi:MAG: glycosyltransferase family 4 protein [Cyanobium sp. M30B3]|nr:MAG: glycosyltransferase family 4 protein [Cyanobium sp. M30B3]
MRLAILSTIEGAAWGGTEEVWVQLARLALARGHEVMAAVDHRIAAAPPVQGLVPLGLRLTSRRPWRSRRWYLLKESLWSDHQALVGFQPDLLVINAGSVLDPLQLPHLRRLCGALAVPQVLFCHFHSDLLAVPQRQMLREFLTSMRHLVFVAEGNRHDLERTLAGELPPSTVIANQSRTRLAAPLPWPQVSPLRLACVARFEVLWKGQDLLLEALACPELLARPWELDLYGAGCDQFYLHELIHHFGLQKRVHVKGFEPDLARIWTDHHLLVLPSRGEGMPLVALEALMHGRPVLATAVGGVGEVVRDGNEGYIAESPTVACLRRTLQRAFSDSEAWQALGQAGHSTAQVFAAADPPAALLNLLERLQ